MKISQQLTLGIWRGMCNASYPGLVLGRASGKWSAILPQGISTSKISECEIGCLKDVKEAERRADYEKEAGEDERC